MSDRFDVAIHQGREPDFEPAAIHVVIDVLRAFTTVHVALEGGCSDVLLADSVDDAFRLAEKHPGRLLAGERDARKIEGFDAGNSPAVVSRMDLTDRGMILTTTNGVRATLHALGADHVLVTGWSNVSGTIRYLESHAASDGVRSVHLIASHPVSDEDMACAEYLAGRLGSPDLPTESEVVHRIRSARSAQKFYGPDFRIRDLDLACRRQPPTYAMVVQQEGSTPKIERAPL